MEILFHPAVLKILCEWKEGEGQEPPTDLLALLVDCKSEVDYEWMDKVLYLYKKTSKRKNDRIRILREAVESKFHLELVGEGNGEDKTVYLLSDLGIVSKDTRGLLRTMRKSLKKIWNDRKSLDPRDNAMKKETPNPGMLKFVCVENRKKPLPETLGQFTPIRFDDEVLITTPTNALGSTVRVRKDVHDSKRLFFIKFSDRPQPPLYGFRKERLYVKNSLSKLPQVLDYEYESEWEDAEDAESVESTEEEEEEEESSCEWIEMDAENTGPSRTNRKPPSLSFPSCRFNILPSFSPSWISLPLVERETFPEELLQELREEMSHHEGTERLIKRFSSKYVIRPSVVSDMLRDPRLSSAATIKKPE
ncbi:hypothetical protein J0A71_01g00380 [Encephalitozoon cuniculi]|nr:hypothetical protein J0A71_01g00380 [Encephalitozoon cuniculi]